MQIFYYVSMLMAVFALTTVNFSEAKHIRRESGENVSISILDHFLLFNNKKNYFAFKKCNRR